MKRTAMAPRKQPMKRRPISPASPAQKAKVRDECCLSCGEDPHGYIPIDPAHVVPRSLGGCDSPDCVIPLCRICHREVDEGRIDLLPLLEPHYRVEQAHAVMHVGLEYARNRLAPSQYPRTERVGE
jgi:hypothetical protein